MGLAQGILLFGTLLMLFMLVFFGLVVLAILFWIWMLVDCLQRKKFEDKLVWIVVLIFLNVFGAILYYFIVKLKDKKFRRRK